MSEKIRLFQQHLHPKMNHEKNGVNPHYLHPNQQNGKAKGGSAIMLEIPDDELDWATIAHHSIALCHIYNRFWVSFFYVFKQASKMRKHKLYLLEMKSAVVIFKPKI